MVVLRTLLLASLATACYSPDVRDCAVTCAATTDCAPGQVCGSDGFCASESVAGTCAKIASTDAGVDGMKPAIDAAIDARPDAFPTVKLFLRIDGRGDVLVVGAGSCDGGSGATNCTFDVKQGGPVTLQATPKNHWVFDRWDDACAAQTTNACVLSPMANVNARVRFVTEDDAL